MAKTAQRPARLPFQALARFDYPPPKQSSIIFYFHPECDHCSYEVGAIQEQLEYFRSTCWHKSMASAGLVLPSRVQLSPIEVEMVYEKLGRPLFEI